MDDLDRFIADQTARDPKFLPAYEAATERRRLAARLAEIRAEKGFSQESLAEAVNSTQAVISRLESGRDFRFSTLQKVTRALGFEEVSDAFRLVSKAPGKGRAAVGGARQRPSARQKSATKVPKGTTRSAKKAKASTKRRA